ncbi:MAG: alpha/beta hydrolase [candidate division Zixibacteria bacterium]|nr:alpha/beta hydrolase [candidate division Zixibacteria bacterium]
MDERYLKLDNELMYIRHNGIKPGRRSLLFVHGLGDSGLSFEDVFKYGQLDSFNIIVPDLIGYGKSSQASSENGYCYEAHLQRLWRLINEYRLDNIILLGHSMGGDLTTLLCQADTDGLIKKYINIEGDVTQFDLFLSGKAIEADREGVFEKWFFNDLMRDKIFFSSQRIRSLRLYYAGLNFCRPEAFLANAKELVARNSSLAGPYKSEIGEIYCSLSNPRVFCYGTKSLSNETLAFLKENNMEVQAFEGAGHSPMVDKSEEFYEFLYNYLD